MVPSKPTAANTAPSGWQALAGFTVSASRAKFFSRYSGVLAHSRMRSTSAGSRGFSNSFFLFASICWYSGPRNSSKWSSTWSAFCGMMAPVQNSCLDPWLASSPQSGRAGLGRLLRRHQCGLRRSLPRRLGLLPDRRVDGHVHVAREDREPVIAMVGAGVVPGMHLPERHTHLLEYVLLLDAGADQVRLDLLDELLELVSGHVVIDQCAVLDVMLGGPLIVVIVAELVAGADHFHAEVFI